jgi:hypothetical protein
MNKKSKQRPIIGDDRPLATECNDRTLPEDVRQKFSLPEGFTIRSVRYKKGSIRFSESYSLQRPLPPAPESYKAENNLGLPRLHELNADHGLSIIFRILKDANLSQLTSKKINKLITDIRSRVSPEKWTEIRLQLAHIKKLGQDRETFVVSLWADLFFQPFSDLWLAAVAQRAHYVEEDDYAFGYLTAQLDRRGEFESHYIRGQAIYENARRGGEIRASQKAPGSQRILTFMRRLVNDGQSVKKAARSAYDQKLGSSPEANRRLWNRHKNKHGT